MVLEYRLDISKLQLSQAISQDGVLETKKQVVKKRKKYRIPMNGMRYFLVGGRI